MDLEYIKKETEKIFPMAVKFRRHLHKYPELGDNEYNTQKYIVEFLDNENIYNYKCGKTGVVAVIEGKQKGKCVGLRADIDALPIQDKKEVDYASVNDGVMHACGHDGHTATAMACAKFFNDNKKNIKGTIKIFFQPAEETIGGAKRMIAEGCMENPDVDYVVGMHLTTEKEVGYVRLNYGTANASTDSFTVNLFGKGGHGAYPETGVDAIVMASQTILAIQTIVSRNLSPFEPSVISIGQINGGTARNIICDKVTLEGTIRSSSEKVRKTNLSRVEEIVTGIASAMGGEAEIIFDENNYIALNNTPEVVDVAKKAAEMIVGEENIIVSDKMSMGGEDFSFFADYTKSAFYYVGCKIKDREDYGMHIDTLDIDEEALLVGMRIHISTILDLLK